MNHLYRIVWSQVSCAWVAVSEISCGKGKSTRSKLVAAAVTLGAAVAQAGPVGGVVASGAGSIKQSGTTTTINQSSPNMSLTWKSFNVAPTETVNFVQPSATAVAVNRIYDTHGSQIMGRLNANGQVYLINPNGVLFGQGAQINVGALVASTLDFNDASLGSHSRSFSGTGTGSVVNWGSINATGSGGQNGTGGFVALLSNSVSNQGSINAPGGTVALGAGSAVTLTFQGSSLVQMKIDQSVLDSQSANGGVIRANGGRVLLSAGAQDALLASVVNNTGVIEARTVENHAGTVVLLGGMAAGSVNVGGTLDASAPNGGNGGFIETSAAHVKVADTARINTAAPAGKTGTWLIDPVDFTIAATGGDITGASLGTLLDSNSVTVLTDTGADTGTNRYGTTGTNGDIFVNDPVSWSASNTLTLNAHRHININRPVTATSGKLELFYGQGSTDGVINGVTSTYNVNAPVNLSAGANFSTQLGTGGTVKNFTVITTLGAENSTTATDLQGMGGNLSAHYVLGSNIDASPTAGWNSDLTAAPTYAGFVPIGQDAKFTGTFDGLGHTISGLTINRPTTTLVGLFGYTGSGSVFQNVGLVGGSVTGRYYVGGLVGYNAGTVSNSYATGSVNGRDFVGGLVGTTILSTISNSYATGSVNGWYGVGGLVGTTIFGTISNSYATSVVSGQGSVGGLVGSDNSGTFSNSYWNTDKTIYGIGNGERLGATGLTSTQMQNAANFIGFNFTSTPGAGGNNWVIVNGDGSLNDSSASGSGRHRGGTTPMLASEYSTNIRNTHQLQLMAMQPAAHYTLGNNVNAASTGLINGVSTDVWGSSGFVPVGNSNIPFTGTFNGQGNTISNLTINRPTADGVGLFGYTGSGSVFQNVGLVGGSVTGRYYVGGLVGSSVHGGVLNSYATGDVTGNTAVGGLVGCVYQGFVDNSYATGVVNGQASVGGLVGHNSYGTVSNSYATGDVSGNMAAGGLVGFNESS